MTEENRDNSGGARTRDSGLIGQAAPHDSARGHAAARRYTRIVRFLRLVLPLTALAIVAVLFSWPHMRGVIEPAMQTEDIPATVGKNELLNPRFESRDNKGQPFTITANRAIQSSRDPDVVILEVPMADITLNSGAWMAAEADRGAYRQKSERLLLEGRVKLFHDKGYEMRTDKLLVNLKTRRAWTDKPVYGQGPAGVIEATGMQAQSDSGQLIFTGPAKLVLNRAVEGL